MTAKHLQREGSDLEQVHLVVQNVQVVLRVSLSLVGRHGWHSESSRQWRLLNLRTKAEVDVDGAASVFLAASFSSPAFSLFISSFLGEMIGWSFLLLEVAELCLDSK